MNLETQGKLKEVLLPFVRSTAKVPHSLIIIERGGG
jgi:hypothetical protein